MKNFDIQWYYDELINIEGSMKELRRQKKQIETELREYFEGQIKDAGKKFGTVNCEHDGFVVKFTTPKKIDWDQDGLAKLYDKIKQHENPDVYMSAKYSVSENAYKTWPDKVKAAFDQHRTEGVGTEKIEIVKKG